MGYVAQIAVVGSSGVAEHSIYSGAFGQGQFRAIEPQGGVRASALLFHQFAYDAH